MQHTFDTIAQAHAFLRFLSDYSASMWEAATYSHTHAATVCYVPANHADANKFKDLAIGFQHGNRAKG